MLSMNGLSESFLEKRMCAKLPLPLVPLYSVRIIQSMLSQLSLIDFNGELSICLSPFIQMRAKLWKC